MTKSRRFGSVAALLVVLSMLLAACGSKGSSTNTPAPAGGQTSTPAPAPAKDVTLRIALNADPPKLDPHQSTALVDRQVFQALFDKLVDFDKDLNVVPDLATHWDISQDGKTYTFQLRQGVKFHDGTDFNADAVKYNFDRMMDPNFVSPRKAEISSIDKVSVVDPYTVKIELKQPFAGLLAVLADRAGMMVSPTEAKKAGVDFDKHPVGTGPFMFKERVKGDSITLVKNDKYWQPGLPKASSVIYKTITDENVKLVNLQSGQLDIIDTVPASQVTALKSDNRVKVNIGPSLQYQGLWLNVKKAPLDKKEVRQALAMAIDRTEFVKVVFGETAVPGLSPFAPGTPVHEDKPIPKADPEGAKKLLAQAGYANGVTISLKIAPSPINAQIAQVIQSMAAKANIKINIEQVEFGQLLDQLGKHNFDMSAVGWSGRPDPDGDIYTFVITGSVDNYSDYSNPKVDQMLKDARVPSNMADRKKIYGDIMKILDDDLPYIYLYHPRDVKGFAPNVTGFVQVPDQMIRVATITKTN